MIGADDTMRVLVIGCGSIGMRHLRNLKSLGIENLMAFDPVADQRELAQRKYGARPFDSLDAALQSGADVAFVTVPTHLHVPIALQAARAGCNLFIEKPLSHTEEGLSELIDAVQRDQLVTMVGCNMRFHPGPAKIKELLEQEVVGRLLFARVHTGSYLPKWRPWQDYRRSYSANATMGGGCLLDCVHEIDLTQWYVGKVEEVFCVAGHLSSLEMNVEDVAALVCKHASGGISEIHLDYVQRTYERGCQIVGEQGSIFWDYNEGTVRWFDAGHTVWKVFAQPKNWQPNQMYIDEMRHFLDCVRKSRATTLPVTDAMEVMRVVFAAKASAHSGCLISVKEGLS